MDKDLLLTSLIDRGWFACDMFLDQATSDNLIAEMQLLPLQVAKIGKGNATHQSLEIRNDSIFWLNEQQGPAQDLYLKKVFELMQFLNQSLYLGLKQFEGHFARYDKNGFYKKHLDQFAGSNERLVSLVTYLNTPVSGGELRIFNRKNPEIIEIDITPKVGSLVCFLSNQIYHEVRPTDSERYSIAGWFRTTIL